MMAARYWAPRDVRVEQVAEPEPGAGEVVLRVEAALTCGTDAKCYRRGHPVLLGPAPAPFGHEYAGVVVARGEDAPFREGDLVCGVNSAPCGTCTACAAGREELCSDLYPLLNGAYAQIFNKRWARTGHLFAGRFHSKPVTEDDQLAQTCRYVMWNPVRAGLCERPEQWPWSASRYGRSGL